jgi:hypothetical protein
MANEMPQHKKMAMGKMASCVGKATVKDGADKTKVKPKK